LRILHNCCAKWHLLQFAQEKSVETRSSGETRAGTQCLMARLRSASLIGLISTRRVGIGVLNVKL